MSGLILPGQPGFGLATAPSGRAQEGPWRGSVSKMSFDEVEQLQSEIAELKGALSGRPDSQGITTDPERLKDRGAMIQKLQQLERRLDMDQSLLPKTAVEKDNLAKELKDLEAELKEASPSWNKQKMSPTSDGFSKSVEHSMHFMATQTKNAERWKQIKRLLEPDNPFADRVENFMTGAAKMPK